MPSGKPAAQEKIIPTAIVVVVVVSIIIAITTTTTFTHQSFKAK